MLGDRHRRESVAGGRLAKLATLPCIVVEGQPDEADLLADRIIENSCRQDLRPLEFARAVAKLKTLKGCNSQTLAKTLGLSGSAMSKAEALLTLPEAVQQMVDARKVSESAAYEISRLPDERSQCDLAQAVAAGGMSRDQVADAVRGRVGKRNVTGKAGRIACKLDGGVSVTLSAGQPWTWDELLAALDRLRREAKKLCDGGKDVSALAKSLRASS